jgi:hypothetical protein
MGLEIDVVEDTADCGRADLGDDLVGDRLACQVLTRPEPSVIYGL